MEIILKCHPVSNSAGLDPIEGQGLTHIKRNLANLVAQFPEIIPFSTSFVACIICSVCPFAWSLCRYDSPNEIFISKVLENCRDESHASV